MDSFWIDIKNGKFEDAIEFASGKDIPNSYNMIIGILYNLIGNTHRFQICKFNYEENNIGNDDIASVLQLAENKYLSANIEMFIGVLYWESSKKELSIPYLEKALKLDPSNPYALNYFGMKFNENNNDKYLDYSLKAIKYKNDYSEAYNNAAVAYINLKKPDDAYKIMIECLQKSKNPHPNTYYNLINIVGESGISIKNRRDQYTIEGSTAISNEKLEELFNMIKDSLVLFNGLMDCFFKQAMYGEAQYFIKKAQEQKIDVPINYYYANIVFLTKNDKNYDEYAKLSIQSEKLDYLEYYNLGSNYYNLNNLQKTIELLTIALGKTPQYDSIYQMQIASDLGSAYVSNKNYDEGIRLIQLALKIAPDDAISLLNLGRAYLGKGDNNTALKYLNDAMKYSNSEELTNYIKKKIESVNK
jgi:tetratricopeptide (TPR) repeat protein